jgi:hypothetical protein
MCGKKCLAWCAALTVLALSPAPIAADELKLDHVIVSYSGISKAYAEAIARTVETARNVAAEQFAFDMPETIRVEVTVDADEQVRLFNDGQDRIFLTIRSEDNLKKPSTSGIYNIYGMCHEVGHLAMYRLILDHSWLKGEGAEGWAHYLGSRLVDAVYAKQGADLWPDKYDYREDGIKRLERQLSAEKPTAMAQAAGAWKQLANIVGDKNIAPIFRAWGQAKFDSGDPGEELGKVLLANSSDQTQQWWNDAQEILILKRPKSQIAAETAADNKPAGQSHELIQDDGKSAGKRSIAGGGHAVRFKAPGDSCYLTEVRIYGSRYGMPSAPRENFHVWLCDEDFKEISDNQFPYSKFPYGNRPRWVSLKIKPTKVPQDFIICVGFNPTATRGVFVHYDGEASGNSIVGLPGEDANDFTDGDWMIRAKVDQR